MRLENKDNKIQTMLVLILFLLPFTNGCSKRPALKVPSSNAEKTVEIDDLLELVKKPIVKVIESVATPVVNHFGRNYDDCSHCPLCARVETEQIFTIDGDSATLINQFPWMVSLGVMENSSWFHFCGGAIISEYRIITAAHCIFSVNYGYHKFTAVRVGDSNLNSTLNNGEIYQINVAIKHPNYKGYGPSGDIAIVFTTEKISFGRNVKPICLTTLPHSNYDPYIDRRAVVTGWGLDENREFGGSLRKADVTAYSYSNCSQRYKRMNQEHFFCAGSKDGSSVTCKGDSGAPLALEVQSTVQQQSFYKVIGVLHGSGTRCTNQTMGHPGLYSNVEKPQILNWILKWTTLEPLFEAARSKEKDTISSLLKYMSQFDPTDEDGLNLSDYFSLPDYVYFIYGLCKPLENVTLFYDDYSIPCSVGFCGREGTEHFKYLRKKLVSICVCKKGYQGTSCKSCQKGYSKQGTICHINAEGN